MDKSSENKKQDKKKSNGLAGGFGREAPVDRLGRATSLLVLDSVIGWGGGVDRRPTIPHTPTPTLESKETKTGTLECNENSQIFKISHVKNINKRPIWHFPIHCL